MVEIDISHGGALVQNYKDIVDFIRFVNNNSSIEQYKKNQKFVKIIANTI